ncbi:MAG: HAD-IA family hydrolase [Caldilineaceae bacterium]
MQLTGLAAHFGDNVSAYDINRWKPEPHLLLHAARCMGFAPAECAVIEDSSVGVTAGLAADAGFPICTR